MQKHNSKFKSDLKTRCYRFSLDIIKLIETLPNEKSCWVIGDQLLRSGTSIGANLVEASASSSKREFKRFHEISLKSGNEAKYWLGLLKDSNKTDEIIINKLLKELTELTNMIAAGILKMKGKRSL
jgi:four helix bundle protein